MNIKKVGTHLLVGNKFPSLPRKYNRVSRGTFHKNNNSFSPDETEIKLKHHLSPNLLDAPNFYRVSPLTINEYNLKNTAVILEDNPDDDRNSIYFQWHSLALDIIESKIFKPTISKANRKAPANICKVYFLNKNVELINSTKTELF